MADRTSIEWTQATWNPDHRLHQGQPWLCPLLCEFLSFLRRLDREFPKSKDLHIVLDNASSHLHANVGAWLDAHPRFRLHFVPTGSSWLNMVEGVFGI